MEGNENNSREWIVYLKNEKAQSYILLSKIFIFFGVVVLTAMLFVRSEFTYGFLFLAFSVVYYFVRKEILSTKIRPGSLSEEYLFLLGFLFLFVKPAFGVMFLIAVVLFHFSTKRLKFLFGDDGVQKDFFPQKGYSWNLLSSVIIKSGILTINFKNDNIIQGYLDKEYKVDESQFNNFISEKLKNNH